MYANTIAHVSLRYLRPRNLNVRISHSKGIRKKQGVRQKGGIGDNVPSHKMDLFIGKNR